MADADRRKWDAKHADRIASGAADDVPGVLADAAPWLPSSGRALDVACGCGAAAVDLARRGLEVFAVDVSLVALADARRRADEAGVGRRVHTLVRDLDDGLPPDLGAFDVVLCARFHSPALWPALRDAVRPGGLLVLEACAEGGPAPTNPAFVVAPGALAAAAPGWEVLLHAPGTTCGRPTERLVARAPLLLA